MRLGEGDILVFRTGHHRRAARARSMEQPSTRRRARARPGSMSIRLPGCMSGGSLRSCQMATARLSRATSSPSAIRSIPSRSQLWACSLPTAFSSRTSRELAKRRGVRLHGRRPAAADTWCDRLALEPDRHFLSGARLRPDRRTRRRWPHLAGGAQQVSAADVLIVGMGGGLVHPVVNGRRSAATKSVALPTARAPASGSSPDVAWVNARWTAAISGSLVSRA